MSLDEELDILDLDEEEIEYDNIMLNEYINLRRVSISKPVTNGYYLFQRCSKLLSVQADFSNLTYAKTMFNGCTSLQEVDLQNALLTDCDSMFADCTSLRKVTGLNVENVTNASNMFKRNMSLVEFPSKLVFSKATQANNFLDGFTGLTEVDIEFPIATSCGSCIRSSTTLVTAKLHVPKSTNVSYIFADCPNLVNAYISGLCSSLDMRNRDKLTIESIKYILDNCNAREDGAAYTLAIHANVKSAFLAKCDKDAEYAASLANANAKGLTLA